MSTNGGATFTNIAGATASSYTFLTVGNENGYQYRCLVTNTCGSPATTTSGAGVLNFNTVPVISAQPPANTTGCVGSPATFNIVATGTGLTYQWQISTNGGTTYTNVATGAVYAGANSNTLTILSVVATQNTNLFRCIVTGICTPAATSTAGLLTVPSDITSQPANITQCAGVTANFSVTATGSSLTYQWQVSTDAGVTFSNLLNSAIYSGVTTTNLTITGSTGALNNNRYRCVVAGGGCNLNSTAAILTVNTAPVVVTQPLPTTLTCVGQNIVISTTATGSALTYQWQLSTDAGATFTNVINAGVYSGATSATLNITGVIATMNNYQYKCVINGGCTPAVTTNVSTISISNPVVITSQPSNAKICINNTASFSVTATGTVLSYQWQVSTLSNPVFTNIPGANSNVYTVTANYQTSGNIYRCVIATVCAGNITTNPATLNVNPNPIIGIVANPSANLYPGATSVISITSVTPVAGVSYQWNKNGVAIPGATGTSITVAVDDIGSYTVTVTDLNGCSAASHNIVINHSQTEKLFIYPNPSSGKFQVRYFSVAGNNTPRTINIYDAKGAKIYSHVYTVNGSYERMDVNLENVNAGIYFVDLWDNNNKRIATGKVVIR